MNITIKELCELPESCSKCKFMYEFYGIKKCQLLNVLKNGGKAIICGDKLNVARKEGCPLVSLEEHDKEIRNKAIEELAEKVKNSICEHTYPYFDKDGKPVSIWNTDGYREIDKIMCEIAEQIKEVGE